MVASILPAASASPSSLQAGHSFSVSASQRGLGRLPATVVSNMADPGRAIRAELARLGGGFGAWNREERSSDRVALHSPDTRERSSAAPVAFPWLVQPI